MREIAIDTETTGLDPAAGHRIVEIACIELLNHVPTGMEFHQYVDPQRDMPIDAYNVHGLDSDFLAGFPTFDKIADSFLEFIGDARLVIHNAEFDLRFINAELKRIDRPPIEAARAIDTLAIARRKYPGAQASLDALCKRFEIDLTERDKHGALIDTRLLAGVYLELIGGRQPDFDLGASGPKGEETQVVERRHRPPRRHRPTAAEEAAHEAFLDGIENPIWRE